MQAEVKKSDVGQMWELVGRWGGEGGAELPDLTKMGK